MENFSINVCTSMHMCLHVQMYCVWMSEYMHACACVFGGCDMCMHVQTCMHAYGVCELFTTVCVCMSWVFMGVPVGASMGHICA